MLGAEPMLSAYDCTRPMLDYTGLSGPNIRARLALDNYMPLVVAREDNAVEAIVVATSSSSFDGTNFWFSPSTDPPTPPAT
jgi:hypothetical protein